MFCFAVARLFGRNHVATLSTSSAAQLMAAYASATPVDEATFAGNLKAVLDLLANTHGFALTADDRANIERHRQLGSSPLAVAHRVSSRVG